MYKWVDSFSLSRVKRNIARDFSDGVLIAEIIHHLFPKLVELHNYSPSNSAAQKKYNWQTLNKKVFRKMGCALSDPEIEDIVACKRGHIETVLHKCKIGFDDYERKLKDRSEQRIYRKQQISSEEISANIDRITRISSSAGRASTDPRMMDPRMKISVEARVKNERPQSSQDFDYEEMLIEKDRIIQHLQDKLKIMGLKVSKLEELLALKDRLISERN